MPAQGSICPVHLLRALSPEGLSSAGTVQVPVIFVLFKQDRGQPSCKLLHLILAQLAFPLHQLCDEENRGGNFIFHLELQHRGCLSCWSRDETPHQRDLITLRHYQVPRIDTAKPAQARIDRAWISLTAKQQIKLSFGY